MVSIGSSVRIEDTPPVPSMEEARRELDAAVLQSKRHCLEATQEGEDHSIKRYIYAVTLMKRDRFFSLHSGRRSRSLTRVFVEQREDRAHSVHPSLPKKTDYAEEDIDEGTVRLEWHETVEGRKADVTEDDKTTIEELEKSLPVEYHQWEHDVKIETEDKSATLTSTIWRVGDHLFSYQEPFDLSVDLPDKIHYFFTGAHLPEKRRRYNSLPNLSVAELYGSSTNLLQEDHSHHSLYGHGFRHIGHTFLSRTMENLGEDRLQLGGRPALQDVIVGENGDVTVSSSSLYHRIPITVFEKGSRRSLHDVQLDQSFQQTIGSGVHYAAPSEFSTTETETHHYAEPDVQSHAEHINESTVVQPPSPDHEHNAESFDQVFKAKFIHVGEAIKEHVHHEDEPIYHHVYEEPIYDEVAKDKPQSDLHYATAVIAVGGDDSHLYKDDEHIYEDIDAHVIQSREYAEPYVYESPRVEAERQNEYAEVVKENIVEKVITSVSQFSSIKKKFESDSHDSHYEKVTAPRRKDYDFDENCNHEILERTPEFTERQVLRDVKPYVGSPTFNKLQKKFFPEDLAARQAQWDQGETVDSSVLNSPTTVVTNNGVTETEYRAYDKNQYEEAQNLVMSSPVDQQTARTTLAIRRMSRNNHWSEDELETPKVKVLDEYIPPNSPFVKVSSPLGSPRSVSVSPTSLKVQAPLSPLASPRSASVSPVPVHRYETANIVLTESHYARPADLHLEVQYVSPSRSPVSPVERVVSSEIKTPSSPIELYQSGFVAERRKMFEKGNAPALPGYTAAKRNEVRPYQRTAATVRLETTRDSPIENKRYESVSEPQVKLRRTTIGAGAVPASQPAPEVKEDENSNHRKSVLEMRKEYEATVKSQPVSTISSPQRSQTNSRRRTGEVQIGSGVTLTSSPPKTSSQIEDESSQARRTVHRTLGKAMHQDTSYTASIGGGVSVTMERRQESPSTSASVNGSGTVVRSTPTSIPVASVRLGVGAVPSSAAPPTPVEAQQVVVDFPPEVKLIEVEDVRESTSAVEEEPTPLQRNGSGRRSWTVKTYENNIRFDNQKLKIMPDVDFVTSNGHLPNGIEKMNGEENAVLRDWDPRPLVRALYEVNYEPRIETKRNRFFTMEGHVEVPSQETNTLAELEREWKSQYMRAKEGRLQIFASHGADDAPAEEIVLSGCDVDANREERTLIVHGGKDKIRILLRVPSAVFDKWRQALLSHAASSQIDAYVKPVLRTMDHLNERVIIIEIGSCSVRGGRLTQEPSLPQSFFPAIGVKTDDGRIIVGEDAFTPQVRHRGEFVRPIQASDPAVERYTMDQEVVRACMSKVVHDLNIDPTKYKVLLSIPQNIPIVLISELLSIALQDIRFQGAAITRQPSLILYAYDVTTGVVVDIGDRLNIVPVIDGYVVDSAICSIPYGATQIREALRKDLCAANKGLYSFQSPIEKLILRYAMEQACYVPEDYGKEEKAGVKDVHVSLDQFDPTPQMPTKFNIDSSRFTCTEGLFRPKKWGLDTKGLHQLVHEAVQMSPIDSRRNLYRNIFLAGGASLLPGLAEKLEQELANIVPNSIHTQVHISPWRYNAAYLGAQVVASSSTFEDKCVTAENLQKFLFNLSTSTF